MSSQRLPAEWEPQDAVMLTWPHKNSPWDWILDDVVELYEALIAAARRDKQREARRQPGASRRLLPTRDWRRLGASPAGRARAHPARGLQRGPPGPAAPPEALVEPAPARLGDLRDRGRRGRARPGSGRRARRGGARPGGRRSSRRWRRSARERGRHARIGLLIKRVAGMVFQGGELLLIRQLSKDIEVGNCHGPVCSEITKIESSRSNRAGQL